MTDAADRETIAWRLGNLEREHERDRTEFVKRLAEQQVTYDAVINQVRGEMKREYLTSERADNRYLTKTELQRGGTVRREWLIVLLAVPGWAAVILQALGH